MIWAGYEIDDGFLVALLCAIRQDLRDRTIDSREDIRSNRGSNRGPGVSSVQTHYTPLLKVPVKTGDHRSIVLHVDMKHLAVAVDAPERYHRLHYFDLVDPNIVDQICGWIEDFIFVATRSDTTYYQNK